jgi:hypothetical protein
MRRAAAIFILVVILSSFLPWRTYAQSGSAAGRIDQLAALYQYGEYVIFRAKLHADQPIETAYLFFQEQGETQTYPRAIQPIPGNAGEYTLEYRLDIDKSPLPPFSTIEYRFEAQPVSGQVISSPLAEFDYFDNRYDWQKLSEGIFQVLWYAGDTTFAQKVLDTAQASLERAQSLLPLAHPQQVSIYTYKDAVDLQNALAASGSNWLAGHAVPEQGVITVALPAGPEQQLLTEQRIPHELMHIVLSQSLGKGYANLPTWLNEGLASTAELFPNPDYQVLLETAYKEDRLLPMSVLCRGFPQDASRALLAYAQSASFTLHLYINHGAEKMMALINLYGDGLDCEQGVSQVYGAGLAELEDQWLQERFGENAASDAFGNLAPWFTILIAALIAPLSLAIIVLIQKRTRKGGIHA